MKAYFVLCTVRHIHDTTWQQEPLVFSEMVFHFINLSSY